MHDSLKNLLPILCNISERFDVFLFPNSLVLQWTFQVFVFFRIILCFENVLVRLMTPSRRLLISYQRSSSKPAYHRNEIAQLHKILGNHKIHYFQLFKQIINVNGDKVCFNTEKNFRIFTFTLQGTEDEFFPHTQKVVQTFFQRIWSTSHVQKVYLFSIPKWKKTQSIRIQTRNLFSVTVGQNFQKLPRNNGLVWKKKQQLLHSEPITTLLLWLWQKFENSR